MYLKKKCACSRRRAASMLVLVLVALTIPGIALAGGAGGDLPYEDGLQKLTTSLTGPVAFAVSVIGVVAAGAMLIFGGDMNGFMRSIVFLVLVIGLMVSATAVLTKMFGITGSVADLGAHLLSNGIC